MIPITARIGLDPADIEESFVRASGPGGQNVNKLSTAVQLRYAIDRLEGMGEAMRARLVRLAGRRLTKDGVLVLVAQEHRTQEMNRAAAIERLVALLKEAAIAPRARRPTKPTLGSKLRRLEGKTRRGSIKQARQGRPDPGD